MTSLTELEKTRRAMLNLLEDLQDEKDIVEQRVQDRTRELEREKEKLLQVTSNMRDGVFLLDAKRNVLFVNERAREMLGGPFGNVSGEQLFERFLNLFANNDIETHLNQCLSGETFEVTDVESWGKFYQLYFNYLESDDTNTDGPPKSECFILFADRTEEKLLERSKSELVAVASHQLRTPLTAMRGNIEMLIDQSFGELNQEQKEILQEAEESTERLIAMVNEMLDIAKIEKGDMEMKIEKIDLDAIAISVINDLKEYAQDHGVDISYKKPNGSAVVYGDEIRLRQVLQNLVDNAIKYNRQSGFIKMTCIVTADDVTVTIQDNGIGIPKAEQESIFDRFYRASNAATSSSSGTGLGLPIAKSIVDRLNGTITFQSEENEGTTFKITLPKKRHPAHTATTNNH